jgi:hypothetical protein
MARDGLVTQSAQPNPAIGRANTVLVFGEGQAATAVLSSVTACAHRSRGRRELAVVGPVQLEAALAEHLRTTVLAAAGEILDRLLPQRGDLCLELSFANLSAASACDLGVQVSGFSADASVFLAILSVWLRIPLPQDLVVTGHIASTEGQIRMVRSLPAKLTAARNDPTLRRFVHPAVEADGSMAALTPDQERQAREAILEARDRLQCTGVCDVDELLRAALREEAVVQGALRTGFFRGGSDEDRGNQSTDRAADFLAEGNEDRFWRVLERQLLHRRSRETKRLVRWRAQYEVRSGRYPSGLGRRLLNLVRSLPPTVRATKKLFPLLPFDQCLGVCRLAGSSDQEDAQHFLDAALGKVVSTARKPPADGPSEVPTDAGASSAVLDAVLSEISEEALAERIGLPADAARASYLLGDVTLESYEAFNETIAAFYLHLLRHTASATTAARPEDVAAEAHQLLEQAFSRTGGYAGALAEARHGTQGGMRYVLDAMTEQFKQDHQRRDIDRVIMQAVDGLDWEARVSFMRALLGRLGPQLPKEIRDQPAERYARHHDTIVKAYAESLDRVRRLFRTF